MFQPMVKMLLNIEQFFHWNFISIVLKFIGEFAQFFGILGKPLTSKIQ
jgi:hypothetical protein